jgi:hypothetical protein
MAAITVKTDSGRRPVVIHKIPREKRFKGLNRPETEREHSANRGYEETKA